MWSTSTKKRYLIAAAAYNLGRILLKLLNVGEPRALQSGLLAAALRLNADMRSTAPLPTEFLSVGSGFEIDFTQSPPDRSQERELCRVVIDYCSQILALRAGQGLNRLQSFDWQPLHILDSR